MEVYSYPEVDIEVIEAAKDSSNLNAASIMFGSSDNLTNCNSVLGSISEA